MRHQLAAPVAAVVELGHRRGELETAMGRMTATARRFEAEFERFKESKQSVYL